jgi:hypothetical protein
MTFVELSVAGRTFSISSLALCQTCDLFAQGHPPSHYAVMSGIPQKFSKRMLTQRTARTSKSPKATLMHFRSCVPSLVTQLSLSN